MWNEPADINILEEVDRAASYINKNGKHPEIGICISPKNIVFEDVKLESLKDNQWKLCINNKRVIDQIILLDKVFKDFIMIVE